MYQEEVKQGRYEPEDVGDENAIEVEFEEESNRILFKDFFKVIAKDEKGMAAVCRSCKLIQCSNHKALSNFRFHLRVCNLWYDL